MSQWWISRTSRDESVFNLLYERRAHRGWTWHTTAISCRHVWLLIIFSLFVSRLRQEYVSDKGCNNLLTFGLPLLPYLDRRYRSFWMRRHSILISTRVPWSISAAAWTTLCLAVCRCQHLRSFFFFNFSLKPYFTALLLHRQDEPRAQRAGELPPPDWWPRAHCPGDHRVQHLGLDGRAGMRFVTRGLLLINICLMLCSLFLFPAASILPGC